MAVALVLGEVLHPSRATKLRLETSVAFSEGEWGASAVQAYPPLGQTCMG